MKASQSSSAPNASQLASASVDDILAWLQVQPEVGLSHAEVERRLVAYGPNEVREARRHPLRRFLSRFWGLSAWMLELILVVSWILGKYTDIVIVGALMVVNAVVSFLQEDRATRAVETLRARLRVQARVCRDQVWQRVPAPQLVPGDVVRLRAGDVVPADIKVLAGDVSIDQSALTGESLAVDRGPSTLLYSGSVVRRGEATGVVVLTGVRTYFGRTTELVQMARPTLHLETVVASFVRWLFLIVGILLSVAGVVAMLRGFPLLELLPLLLVLLLSAVPVALPVMFTVSMAVGALELARRGVLVTRLSAAEDAATMDVLCIDKTGTMTLNRLAIADIVPLHAYAPAEVLLAGALASQEANQDPIDLAFLAAAGEQGLSEQLATIPRLSFTPFDAQTRRTEAIVVQDGQHVRVMKGAVMTVVEACHLDPGALAKVNTRAHAHANRGHRVLGVARGPEDGPLTLVGLVTLSDPPRPDAPRLIAALRTLGVRLTMLTGDALPIAQDIAHSMGLGAVRSVADLPPPSEGAATDTEALFETIDGFAEVYPEDKYRVVRTLQRAGHVVGMTGDGVNDAPALRQAEVGIAVANATDVAKAAASVVLTAEGLDNIVSLVEQGRVIYQRMLTWIINKISRTILKAGLVTIAFLFTGTFVVSSLGMIVLVFLTDFAKIALATDRVQGSPYPDTWTLTGPVTLGTVLGVLMVVEALGVVALGRVVFHLWTDNGALQTFTFQTLFYFSLFSILSIRERRWFWASRPSTTLLVVLILDGIVGTGLSTIGLPGLTPLPWEPTVSTLVAAMLCALGVNDAVKVVCIRRNILPAGAARGRGSREHQGG